MAENDEENVIETEEASAGGPKTHDSAGTRLRAETPGLLTQEELDRRQERIGTTRRRGGPDLGKQVPSRRTAAAAREEEEVPPTETEEPPGPPPPPSP